MLKIATVIAGALALGSLAGGTPAFAADLSSCRSVESYSGNSVVYTGTCPSGLINAISENFYASKPRITGESFGKRFDVRLRRGDRVSVTGTYGRSSVNAARTRGWLASGRFALTATGTFGGSSVRCYTTGRLRGPSVDQTKWGGLIVNGNSNMSASAKAWKRCAFLVLVMEGYAYTEV